MTLTCRFCRSALEDVSNHSAGIDTRECPTCGARESIGVERLPDPDRLRDRSETLEQLADEIEESEIASRFEVTP